MSVSRTELVAYLTHSLRPDQYQDYCPNGLQVEGRASVARLATGVTACQALLDKAIAWEADAILVHHGYFWRNEQPEITGMKRRRLRALLQHDVNLLAYHLPLDVHPHFGNNACLGRLMGTDQYGPLQPADPANPGCIGTLPAALSAGEFRISVEKITGKPALHIGDSDAPVRRIAWCTGAAQSYIQAAVDAGADLYLTGEASEQTVHIAREEGIHFVAAGHHDTERFGVQALGEHLAQYFKMEHCFFNIDNPV